MKKLALIIFFDAFVLMLLGLIIVMSASSTYSEFKFDSLFHLFSSHFFKVVFGILFMILFSFIPYEVYKEFSKPAILLITLILIITLFVAPEIKGAGRWIRLGAISFQPADIAKLILIIHLAFLLESKKDSLQYFKEGFLYLFLWIVIISGLVIIQPNISNGLLLPFISLMLLYVGGVKLRHIFAAALFCAFAGGIAALVFTHSRARLFTFVHSGQPGVKPYIQVRQALLGLGSGHFFGVGLGKSLQSNLFLPEAYGDFIFAILGEELGYIGSVIVLLSYLVFFFAGILIAKKAKDKFGQLLAFGISFSIVVYAFVNVAVASGIFPTTGLPLPFISYGGTSLIFICISVGILINIALSNLPTINVNSAITVAGNQPVSEVLS
jgi:cell division protein FtsW